MNNVYKPIKETRDCLKISLNILNEILISYSDEVESLTNYNSDNLLETSKNINIKHITDVCNIIVNKKNFNTILIETHFDDSEIVNTSIRIISKAFDILSKITEICEHQINHLNSLNYSKQSIQSIQSFQSSLSNKSDHSSNKEFKFIGLDFIYLKTNIINMDDLCFIGVLKAILQSYSHYSDLHVNTLMIILQLIPALKDKTIIVI